MNSPVKIPETICLIQPFTRPDRLQDWPQTPQMHSGHLADSNRGWRTQYPEVLADACIACNLCFLFCPDAAIYNNEQGIPQIIDDWCKGCGICAVECPKNAIVMTHAVTTGESDE